MRSERATLVRYLLALTSWTAAGQALLASVYVQHALVEPFSRWQGALATKGIVSRLCRR